MAIEQIVPIFITLKGDGTNTAFVFALANLYQGGFGGSVPVGTAGVVPSSVTINNPPVPITSATVDANGNITITFTTAPGSGVQYTLEVDLTYNSGAATSASPTQTSNVNITNTTVPISGTITVGSISGTVAVTQSTSPWVVSLASTTITGTVAVTQSGAWTVASTQSGNWTSRIVGNSGSTLDALVTPNTAPTNGLAILGVFPTVTPSLTTGQSAALQLDVSGRANVDLQSLAGTQLGAPSNYGTSPGAVEVQGVNAFITNTPAVTLTSTTITGTVAVTQSTSPWVVSNSGTFAVQATQTTSPWVVGGPAASGATATGNPILNGGVFNTTQPTVTTGQIVDLQTTARGALIIASGVDALNVSTASSGTTNTALAT